MPNTPAAAPATKQSEPYTVTTSADQMSVAANGQLISVKRIWFETVMGDQGHVDVPKAGFTAVKAKAAIEAEVDQLLQLHGF